MTKRATAAAAMVLALAAVAGAQEFQVQELETWSGTLPCPDCAGLRTLLTLRPDGVYFRQVSRMSSGNAGQRSFEIGAWKTSGTEVTLTSSTQVSEKFTSAGGALQLVGCTAGTDACQLTREPEARVPEGTYRVRGLYRAQAGRRTLEVCGAALTLAVVPSGRPKQMERLAEAVKGGKAALMSVSGRLSGAPGHEQLELANVIASEPGGACESH